MATKLARVRSRHITRQSYSDGSDGGRRISGFRGSMLRELFVARPPSRSFRRELGAELLQGPLHEPALSGIELADPAAMKSVVKGCGFEGGECGRAVKGEALHLVPDEESSIFEHRLARDFGLEPPNACELPDDAAHARRAPSSLLPCRALEEGKEAIPRESPRREDESTEERFRVHRRRA